MAGPALGGLLFGAAAALPFFVDGFSFMFSAVLLFLALRPRAATAVAKERPAATKGGLTGDVRDGLRFFLRSPVLRVLSAFRTGALCPANWARGDATLTSEDDWLGKVSRTDPSAAPTATRSTHAAIALGRRSRARH